MNRFYEELKTALALPEGDIWSETVLAGEHAGEKRLPYAAPSAPWETGVSKAAGTVQLAAFVLPHQRVRTERATNISLFGLTALL